MRLVQPSSLPQLAPAPQLQLAQVANHRDQSPTIVHSELYLQPLQLDRQLVAQWAGHQDFLQEETLMDSHLPQPLLRPMSRVASRNPRASHIPSHLSMLSKRLLLWVSQALDNQAHNEASRSNLDLPDTTQRPTSDRILLPRLLDE